MVGLPGRKKSLIFRYEFCTFFLLMTNRFTSTFIAWDRRARALFCFCMMVWQVIIILRFFAKNSDIVPDLHKLFDGTKGSGFKNCYSSHSYCRINCFVFLLLFNLHGDAIDL